VSLPAFLVPEAEAHLAEFVGQAPDPYVSLGPKGARPARSNFHTIWDKHANRPKPRSTRLATHRQHPRRGNRSHAARADGSMGHHSTRAALIYLHARDHRDRVIADGLDTIVGTAALSSQQTVSSPRGACGGHEATATEYQTSTIEDKPFTSKNARSGRPGSTGMASLEGCAYCAVRSPDRWSGRVTGTRY
jgi:hypothetical protein